ncbi:MAG: NupC/NupG family nucleoside CNT transporter [Candidatus Sumerlaeia bacterium]|nr:NupC/NupG family nucleoside CNT transporter [Candidatus Sumerlaeia bacterium]
MIYLQPLLGMVCMILFCMAVSAHRRLAVRQWRILVWGLGLQFVFALVVLKTQAGRAFFDLMNDAFLALLNFSNEGAKFAFGDLADPARKPLVLTFAILTSIIFFASLMAVLYHLGVMQLIVKAMAWIMARTMGTSGAESLSSAANIFVGMTEAPLIIRPYLPTMTRSELMAVMVGGFANIAGGVMGAYVGILHEHIPNIAGHLMAASVMTAPGSLLFAKLLYPETETPETAGMVRVKMKSPYDNVVDAAAGGASEGMQLTINVVAMLIAFIALVAMINGLLGYMSVQWFHAAAPMTVQKIFGYLFCPLAWLMGVPAGESVAVGQLMGTKTILNEMLAYLQLKDMVATLSPRTVIIASYALCGFANLGSVGITLGGLTILAPQRRGELARFGLPAMFGGMFSTCMTACIAALLMPTGGVFANVPK